jgi:hypothetical protein
VLANVQQQRLSLPGTLIVFELVVTKKSICLELNGKQI